MRSTPSKPAVCDCRHSIEGTCRRFPPVRAVENGRNVWQFPPASAECGEKAAPEQAPAEAGKPAAKRARAPQGGKAKAAVDGER